MNSCAAPPVAKPPRRRWLGALAAALTGFVALKMFARRGRVAGAPAVAPHHPVWPAQVKANPRVVLRPSAESVKRHG
jgi:hypothetical protein